MKKYFLILSTLLLLQTSTSCSNSELDLYPPSADEITGADTEQKLQQLLNGGYLAMANTSVYGTKAMVFGDLMGDNMYVNVNPSFLDTYNFNYNGSQQGDFGGFYSTLYNAIAKCNLVINNDKIVSSPNLERIKGEAKALRALAYFTLVNYFSSSPTSGLNQEYGVPLVLENYDVSIQPARASIAEVYTQIIKDLQEGIATIEDLPAKKSIIGKNTAKLILAKVYLTRRGAGDAQAALQMATDVIAAGKTLEDTFQVKEDAGVVTPIDGATYNSYYTSMDDLFAENHNETLWELDLDANTNRLTGIGANIALPAYYYRVDPKKCFLFNKTFYDSFGSNNDIRRGTPGPNSMLTTTGVPASDNPKGYWTSKYPQISDEGRYFRNIKVFRFSEAYLLRVEALHLVGQDAQALIELNNFAKSRNGKVYTGADIFTDIMTERSKELYGEGQRFLDIKRYNLPIHRPSNCSKCDLAANDKLFVVPVPQDAMNANPNLTQYPGY